MNFYKINLHLELLKMGRFLLLHRIYPGLLRREGLSRKQLKLLRM
jgi:hypothetical protein